MPKNKNALKKIHIKRACRCCLTERGHLREIMSTKIPMMIESCAAVKISECDGLPKHVCVSCFHQIAKLYTFKKKVERSDRILRNYLRQRNKMKGQEYSDILHKAVDDASIAGEEDSVGTATVDSVDTYESEEDIPLSLSYSKSVQSEESVERDSGRLILGMESDSEVKNLNDEITRDGGGILSEQILNDGPPPLVPLVSKKSNEHIADTSVSKILPTAPPLVPITPLPNLNSTVIVNNLAASIDEAIDLKLQCSACEEEFSSIVALKEHRLQICQANKLQCNICRKEFKDQKRLIGHLKGHMVVKDYCCKICGKCYPNPSTLQVHMRAHTGEKPFNCQICNKGFTRWAGVVCHMKTHNANKPHKCDICGKGFKMSSNLVRHKVLHAGSLPFCCSYCSKTFSQAENLQLHIRSYHTHERPYLCNECGKGFVSSTRLNRHMWIHTGYKPYQCKYCTKAYSNSNDLKNHERNHGCGVSELDKRYACKHCDMRFFHRCRLVKHMKTHKNPYSCTDCSKSFSTETLLNKHKSIKHSETSVNVASEIVYIKSEPL